jgi:hypothetical protein
MSRHFPLSVSDIPRPSGDISAMVARWRANGTTPPVTLHAMPDRVPARRGPIHAAALAVTLLIVAIVGNGLMGHG